MIPSLACLVRPLSIAMHSTSLPTGDAPKSCPLAARYSHLDLRSQQAVIDNSQGWPNLVPHIRQGLFTAVDEGLITMAFAVDELLVQIPHQSVLRRTQKALTSGSPAVQP